MGRGSSKAGGGGGAAKITTNTVQAANFDSQDSKDIMNTPIETRRTRNDPRTMASLEKSQPLTDLRDNLDKAAVGTAFGVTYSDGESVIYEKVSNGGWNTTTLHNDGSVSWGGGYPKSSKSVDFIVEVNRRRSVTTPISDAAMTRYKNFRSNTSIEWNR